MDHVRVLSRHSTEPIPAVRDGIVVAWNFTPDGPELSPNRGRTLTERHFLLTDVGVKLVIPSWWGEQERDTWYVDLVQIEWEGTLCRIRDLYLDVVVPTDGRPYRMLDLDEFADALESGALSLADAVDGLQRWQQFLDKYLHTTGAIDTVRQWSNFPPRKIAFLAELPESAFDQSTAGGDVPAKADMGGV